MSFLFRLKGVSKKSIKIEIKQMLVDLELENKSQNYSIELSGVGFCFHFRLHQNYF